MNTLRFSLILLLFSNFASAQSNQAPPIVSPEIMPDRQVTFRLFAPKASEVGLVGDWMPPGTPEKMTRDERGVWSTTVGPLESGTAIYSLVVDGMSMADPVNPRIKLRATTSASLVDVPGDPTELWQPQAVPHGTVEINWRKSNLLGDTRAYYVYTPPGYEKRRFGRYPVVYLLHGVNDTAAGWTDVGRAHFILDNLIAQKRAVPMIVVMPWGHALPFNGARTNGPTFFEDNATLVEKYLLEEVIPQVETKYRAAKNRERRAIMGLSMGGGHALKIGLGHLDRFSAIGMFSSGVPGNFESRYQGVLDQPAKTNAKLDLFWIGCGSEDPAFERNQRLSETLAAHGIQHTFRATPGRHTYTVWRRYLAEVAPLLFQPQ